MSPRLVVAVLLSLSLFQAGCSRPTTGVQGKVPLTKVTGSISVDGNPTGGVIVKYVPASDIAEKREAYVKSFTVQTSGDGTFALKTYVPADGVPAGEYKLYCQYFPPEEQVKRRETGEDRFGGKYFLPKPPVKSFSVAEGDEVDLGVIELKSAPKRSR